MTKMTLIINSIPRKSCGHFKGFIHKESKLCYSNSKGNNRDRFGTYTAEQQEVVISTLYKCVENNSTRTYLNKKRLQSLRSLFEQNQNLRNLEPLLSINGFGPKLLHRICDSILQDKTQNESNIEVYSEEKSEIEDFNIRKLRLPIGLVTPVPVSMSGAESVVSIKLGINAISWARLNTNEGHVDTWDVFDISQWVEKKFDVHTITDLVMVLRQNIPDGDIYVMENNNWSNVANIKKPMKYHIQEAMLTTSICAVFNLIDAKKEPKKDISNRLYFLKSYVPFRLFNKIVGSEKVSAEDTVQKMIQGIPDDRHKAITFINGTADHFQAMNGSQRDVMCNALLLVVSFTELILYRNAIACNIIIGKTLNNKGKKIEPISLLT